MPKCCRLNCKAQSPRKVEWTCIALSDLICSRHRSLKLFDLTSISQFSLGESIFLHLVQYQCHFPPKIWQGAGCFSTLCNWCEEQDKEKSFTKKKKKKKKRGVGGLRNHFNPIFPFIETNIQIQRDTNREMGTCICLIETYETSCSASVVYQCTCKYCGHCEDAGYSRPMCSWRTAALLTREKHLWSFNASFVSSFYSLPRTLHNAQGYIVTITNGW